MARRNTAPDDETLQAYHDGELGFWARRRVARRIEGSAETRERLANLALLGELVRESQSPAPVPDLWADIVRELPAAAPDAGRTAGGPARPGRWGEALGWLLRPAGAAVAAAAAAGVALFALSGGEPADMADVVQYLDPGENSVMLLQGEDEATIIWVMEPAPVETSSRGERAVI